MLLSKSSSPTNARKIVWIERSKTLKGIVMLRLPLVVALLCMTLLSACATSDLRVPEAMLTCPEDVRPAGGRLTDNEIAEVIERLDARGDVCAQKLEDLRRWLTRRGAVIPASR